MADRKIVGYRFYGEFGDFSADLVFGRVLSKGKPLKEPLEPLQFKVLVFFLQRPNRPIARNDIDPLHEDVSRDYVRHPADAYIQKITSKLKLQHGELFQTVRGVGYTLRANVEPIYEGGSEEALALYEAAVALFNQHTLESMRMALGHSEEVVSQSPPDEAKALVEAAYNALNLGIAAYCADVPTETMPKARNYAERALRLDPGMGRAYGVLGLISLIYDFNWEEAESKLNKAIALDKKERSSLLSLAHLYVASGRMDDAKRAAADAVRANAVDQIVHASEGWIHLLSGDIEEAIRLGEQVAFKRFALSPPAHLLLGLAYEQAGEVSKARTCFKRTKELELRHIPLDIACIGHLEGRQGNEKVAIGKLRELEKLVVKGEAAYVSEYCKALIYVGLGKLDDAMNSLELAYEQRCDWLIHLMVEPRWQPIRKRKRFLRLAQTVGIPTVLPKLGGVN